MRFSAIFAVASLAVAPVFAASNQTLTDMATLDSKAKDAQSAVKDYSGGLYSAYKVATAVYGAHQAAGAVRKSMAAEDEPFTSDQWPEYQKSSNSFCSTLSDTLDSAISKAPDIKNNGVFAYIAQGMISNLYNEKTAFQKQVKSKLSEEQWKSLEPCSQKVDQKYKDAGAAFQN